MSMRRLQVSALAFLALAAPAAAEIFRCVGAGGEVRYVSSAAQCPNAVPLAEKDGAVLRVQKSTAPLATARPGAPSPGARKASPASQDAGSAADEIAWRTRKRDAEQKLHALEAEEAHLDDAVHWCNKGNEVVAKNPRTGIREPISCDQIDAEHARVEDELATLRAYLDGGLEEECRQAGCMPGWIR
jgi:hypothetical protein